MHNRHASVDQLYGGRRLKMDGDSAIDLGAGQWLGFVTYANGEEGIWIAQGNSRDPVPLGCCCPECAPHEQLGKLTNLPANHAERTKTHD